MGVEQTLGVGIAQSGKSLAPAFNRQGFDFLQEQEFSHTKTALKTRDSYQGHKTAGM
jgi:hypothetical protein